MNIKEELIIEAASKVHEDWCIQELKAFFKRMQNGLKNGITLLELLENACYKGEQKRNEVVLDVSLLPKYSNEILKVTNSFEDFMFLIRSGVIKVKRYTKRTLTEEEQLNAGDNYKVETGEENILRKFTSLSAVSKKENLEAAIGAYNVYEELSKAGITIEQMETDNNLRNLIGLAIHTDWLKRNKNHPNESLKVPFNELDEWTRGQDLTVFDALISVVKQNKDKYIVETVSGYKLPDYETEEFLILAKIKKKQ